MSDKQLDKMAKKAKDLRDEISKVQAEFPGAIGPVLGDLVRALDLFEQRKNSYPELFSDVKTRPSREEQMIRSAEINLQKQKDMLADMKKRKAYSLANPGRAEVVEHEAIERQVERVAQAERQLAKAKGEHQAYSDSRKEAIRAKKEAERAEYEQGISSWQQGWREYSAKQRQKNATPE